MEKVEDVGNGRAEPLDATVYVFWLTKIIKSTIVVNQEV